MATGTVKNAKLIFGAFVSVDVKLLSAAREEGTNFNLVGRNAAGNVVKATQQYVVDGQVVPYQDLLRGLDIGNDRFAVFEKGELETTKVTKSEDIIIERFVPMVEVDPVFFDASYLLVPDLGKSKNPNAASVTAYELLYATLLSSGLAGVAKMEMRGKEHNVFIRVCGNGLMMHTIFCSNEVRNVPEYNAPRNVNVNETHLEICLQLVKSISGHFDPAGVTSVQDTNVQALIDRKKAEALGTTGYQAPKTPTQSSTANAGDSLLAALQASLKMTADRKKAAEAVNV